jgi:hypothetical protein
MEASLANKRKQLRDFRQRHAERMAAAINSDGGQAEAIGRADDRESQPDSATVKLNASFIAPTQPAQLKPHSP